MGSSRQTLNESTGRILSKLARLLPGLLALMAAILFSALLAWLIG